MESITRNTDTLTNFRGTTCKSFVIGKKDISFASSAIEMSSTENLSQYKTLVVKNSQDGKSKVIYDMEIKANAIRYVSEEPKGLTGLHLMDGSVIMIKGSTAGVESDVVSTDPAFPGEIVTFADTSGKVITKSGYRIVRSTDFPAGNMTIETTKDLETLINAYLNDADLDSKVPTMKAVIDYVGTIDDILELRRQGKLPAE